MNVWTRMTTSKEFQEIAHCGCEFTVHISEENGRLPRRTDGAGGRFSPGVLCRSMNRFGLRLPLVVRLRAQHDYSRAASFLLPVEGFQKLTKRYLSGCFGGALGLIGTILYPNGEWLAVAMKFPCPRSETTLCYQDMINVGRHAFVPRQRLRNAAAARSSRRLIRPSLASMGEPRDWATVPRL
jgi:hypothetical protein